MKYGYPEEVRLQLKILRREVEYMWRWGCLVPHPPIIVPEVGKGREEEAGDTLLALERLSENLSEEVPDILLVLSPHSSYSRGLHFTLADTYEGSLSMFQAPQVKIISRGSTEKGRKLSGFLDSKGIGVNVEVKNMASLDHGVTVPLYFFMKKWGRIPDLILANPIGLTLDEAEMMGKALSDFNDDRSWGLVASGDLSHSLKRGAPGGYHPDGIAFDNKVVDAIKNGNPKSLVNLDRDFVDNAAECGLRSAIILLSALPDVPFNVLSYEGPFGVGYCVAQSELSSKKEKAESDPYTSLARMTVERYIEDGGLPDSFATDMKADERLQYSRGCFVSIKNKDGTLRGCIGTIGPTRETLAEEIIANAISASTRDPRFPPLRERELENVNFSVDVLGVPEAISDIEQLDPQIYGVIVEKGYSRGVLLPALENVHTVHDQLEIAASKAGIRDMEGARIFRFTVERHSESEKSGGE